MRSMVVVPLLLAMLCSALSAQEGPPRLGRVHFPASTTPEAHREFETGVLWLHSFEYDRAAAAFQRAQHLDPGFALAHWGEAMTHTHPIWNEQNLPAARGVLNRLAPSATTRAERAPTHRERMYLEAVEILYGEGSKPLRDTLYAHAMERLVRAHPEDLEAKAFYALALLGLSQGVRDTATYRRAAAWADTVFAANPDHPGAAHYLIHAWDDPFHAHLGMEAARAYARIAPDAAHAQHMTTHIFLALGMWEEVIAQNTIAMDLTARLPGHYTLWLHYALLQQGRAREAATFLAELRENMELRRSRREGILAVMRAAHVLGTDLWDEGPGLWEIDLAGAGPPARAAEAYQRGAHAFFRQRNAAELAAMARQLSALADEAAGGSDEPDEGPTAGAIRVMARELEGLRHLLAGRRAMGIRILREATAMEDALPLEFGPPAIVQPSHELLGMILAQDDPAAAIQSFQRALELAPGRMVSLMGLAAAAAEAGNLPLARSALATLERNLERADPDTRATLALLRARIPVGGR